MPEAVRRWTSPKGARPAARSALFSARACGGSVEWQGIRRGFASSGLMVVARRSSDLCHVELGGIEPGEGGLDS